MTGQDPYCIWNDLDAHYVPLYQDGTEGGGVPKPPPYPSRHWAVLKAFGEFSWNQEAKMHGAKLPGEEEEERARVKRDRAERRKDRET